MGDSFLLPKNVKEFNLTSFSHNTITITWTWWWGDKTEGGNVTLTVAVLKVISERGVSTELLRLSRLLNSLILAKPLRAKACKIKSTPCTTSTYISYLNSPHKSLQKLTRCITHMCYHQSKHLNIFCYMILSLGIFYPRKNHNRLTPYNINRRSDFFQWINWGFKCIDIVIWTD